MKYPEEELQLKASLLILFCIFWFIPTSFAILFDSTVIIFWIFGLMPFTMFFLPAFGHFIG